MKRTHIPVLLTLTTLTSLLPAQDYSLRWTRIGSGSATMTGGKFTVEAILNPTSPAEMKGGSFRVSTSIASLVQVIQTPGAPLLAVTRASGTGQVTVSWPLSAVDWVLQTSPTLGQTPRPWTDVSPATYQTNATHRFITIPNPTGTAFYRLSRP